jgi:hypothetical protein
MSSNVKLGLLASLILILALVLGCSDKEESSSVGPQVSPPIATEVVQGELKIADNVGITPDELTVLTFAGEQAVGGNGSFNVSTPRTEGLQVLLFNENVSGKPVYLGLYDPGDDNLQANDTSTALCLALMNPFLVYATQEQRREYLEAVKQSPYYDDLLNLLKNAYAANAAKALDYETNPAIYQTSVLLMKEVMERLGSKKLNGAYYPELYEPPYIVDAAGPDITFVSPRYAWYVAGTYPDNGALKETITLNRKEKVVNFEWGWPPRVHSDPAETPYQLGDGYYKIYLAQGYDFTKILEFNDPVGRGTLYNSGQSILYIVDLIVGALPIPDFAKLPHYLRVRAEDAWELGRDIADRDVTEFLIDFLDLMAYNSEQIALWIWLGYQNEAAHKWISEAAGLIQNVALVLKLLGFLNEQGPFFLDIVFAPHEVTYFVTQEGGVITSMTENHPPAAAFMITPPAGVIGTLFTFDASTTIDDNDALGSLEFRWDFDGDGTWDTQFANDYTATHTYEVQGSYMVLLEVRDTHGSSSQVSRVLNIGGGAGTATHIKLFRDNIPWYGSSPPFNVDAQVVVLESMGFTEGVGPYTYEIIPSSQFGTVDLIPGEDLIILSNDQSQTFYNNYAANQVKFTNFVYMGGSMFWEACDGGWNQGYMDYAGVILPGNVDGVLSYDYYNYVTDQALPLVSGLPDQLDHNYASHEGFTNLPEGTITYTTDSYGRATLLEFNLGGGWMLMTGQPLEHQYRSVYGSPDMEELFPRVISHFTGVSLKNRPVVNVDITGDAPSSGPRQ